MFSAATAVVLSSHHHGVREGSVAMVAVNTGSWKVLLRCVRIACGCNCKQTKPRILMISVTTPSPPRAAGGRELVRSGDTLRA